MKVIILEEGADLDALSSAYGALLLFPDSVLLRPTYLSRKASEVFKLYRHRFRIVEDLLQEFELILTDHHRLDDYLSLYGNRVKDVYVYDHHPKPLERVKGRMEPVGSATTLVVEELIQSGISVDPESATLLALGIYEDTGFFTYEGTTPRDLRALGWLLEKGADLRTIRNILHETFSKETIDFLSEHLESVESLFVDGRIVVIVVIKAQDYKPDVLRFVYDLREVKDSDAFFVIVDAGSKTYLFGRSIKGGFDVSKVLETLGGGGHEFASALKLEGVSAERLRSVLTSVLKGERVHLRIKDIMTAPPFMLHKDISVEQAILELSQRGFAGCPVVDDTGRLVGVVFKKSLMKVPKSMVKEPIEKFMSTDLHTLSPEDLVWKAEEMLSKFGEKLIPVVDMQGYPLGVVTRMDIIHAIRGHYTHTKGYTRKVKLPDYIENLARKVGQVAQSLGYRAYLIGGVVRDLLLGKKVYDLDFVVEGDAIMVAKEFAYRHGVDVHPFPEFGTAHLKVGDIKVEFATTRRESYPHPGSYPCVEYASLREDVLRRDFAINAMAISVNGEDFGTLIDYFGGHRDLKDRIVRVLHPLSFVEDPVRILRALRFAGRLGFKLSKGTEKLLKSAVSFIKLAPKGRLFNEVRLALMEERVLEILELYKKYRVLEQIIPGFVWSKDLEERLLKLKQVIDWHRIEFPKEALDYGWIYLMIILLRVDAGRELLVEMSAPGWVRSAYELCKKELHRIRDSLQKAQKNSEVYDILKGKPLAPLLLLMTYEDIREKVKLYMERLRFVKADVSKFKHLEGRELGRAVEEEKKKIMDALT